MHRALISSQRRVSKNEITTSSTTTSPAQQHHQRNEITTKSPAQHNEITSTTKAPAQPSNAKQDRIAHNRRRKSALKTNFRHPSSKNVILQRFLIRVFKGK
jgi:hypothetical protein